MNSTWRTQCSSKWPGRWPTRVSTPGVGALEGKDSSGWGPGTLSCRRTGLLGEPLGPGQGGCDSCVLEGLGGRRWVGEGWLV